MKHRTVSLRPLVCTLLAALLFLAAQPLLAQPPCCQLGDVNDSGTVSGIDLVQLRQHILDLSCLDNACRGDVDGDGAVTEDDITLIQEYILGIRSTFPRCGDLDGDGVSEWPGDDLNCFTAVAVGGSTAGCFTGPVDANQDGTLNVDDVFAFMGLDEGGDLAVCACYQPFGE